MVAVGIIALVVLCIIGIPIYLAILAGAFIMLIIGQSQDPIIPISIMFNRLTDPSLIALPLFVVLGQILAYGGSGKPLMRLLNSFMGHLPGGPAYALVIASVLVAAMCASPIAAVAAFGPLIVPMLVGLGYSQYFALGLLISSATLAPLIPPNNIGIIYSFLVQPLTSENVGVDVLWTASLIPGLLIALLLCVFVFVHSRRGHFDKLPLSNWSERWAAIKEAWPVAITPVAVLGPLYAGWATPTEVATFGVVWVILISHFAYHGLTLSNFWLSCTSTMRVLGVLFLIIIAAILLTQAITFAQLPQDITEWIRDAGLNWWEFMAVIIIAYLLMGMFLDSTAMVLITVPMLTVTVISLDISPIVFGVFVTIAVNLANVTPPYGLTLFATQSITGKPYSFVVRSCLLFLPALLIGMLLIAFIPWLSTWLPSIIIK